MMGILPLTYSQCPITQWVQAPYVEQKMGLNSAARPPPNWMRNLIAAIPQLVWAGDKHTSHGWKRSPIREWIGSGHIEYVRAFIQYVPKGLPMDGLSIVDYAAMQDADPQIIDALFINGHRATREVWGHVLSIAIHKRRFIGKWVFWLSSAQPIPRMPSVVRAMYQDLVDTCQDPDTMLHPTGSGNWRTIYRQVANLLQAHDFAFPSDNTIPDIERLTL